MAAQLETEMATKYLQLRIHELTCVKMTENRQNFLGISLETDPDAIDISAIVADTVQGVVAVAPPVRLGNRFNDGRRETFSPPKVIAEVPISDTDGFPRRVQLTVNMAEKDDGAGFDDLLTQVAEELADTLGDEIGGVIDSETIERVAVEVVRDGIKAIFSEITKALGLGDDPFRPIVLSHELASFAAAPSGTTSVDIFEPDPKHHGKFKLTYGWHIADHASITAPVPTGGADMGRSTAALSASRVPYARPFRTFRFARPMSKHAVPVTIKRPATKATAKAPAKPAKQMWLYPMSVRGLGDKPPK